MKDHLIWDFLAGLLGDKITRYLMKKDRKINIPFFLLYAVSFTVIYSAATAFLTVIYFINKTEIAWKGVGIFSLATAFCIALSTVIVDKIKKYRK